MTATPARTERLTDLPHLSGYTSVVFGGAIVLAGTALNEDLATSGPWPAGSASS